MKPTKVTRSHFNRQAILGFQKHYGALPKIILGGVAFAPADVTAALQKSIDATATTTSAAAQFHQAVSDEQTAHAAGDAVYRDLKAFVLTQFKQSPDVLAEFGFNQIARQVPNAETKLVAVGKRKATRAARRTMGKRQKAKITGVVPAVNPPTTK
jgi:hypothetical protein